MLGRDIRFMFVLALLAMCACLPSKASTYPVRFTMVSMMEAKVEILDCVGLSGMYPRVVISPRHPDGRNHFQGLWSFGRTAVIPKNFEIQWRVGDAPEIHKQQLTLDCVPKGGDGVIVLEISEENQWRVWFKSEGP